MEEGIVKTCGQCQFGKIMSQDITKRVCWGAPPQVVAVTPKGITSIRPLVGANDEACALYAARGTLEFSTAAPRQAEVPIE